MATKLDPVTPKIDYYSRPRSHNQYSAKQCRIQLMVDFPWIYSADIQSVIAFRHYQYAKAHKDLCRIMEELDVAEPPPPDDKSRIRGGPKSAKVTLVNDAKMKKTLTVQRMRQKRDMDGVSEAKMQRDLLAEVKFVREQVRMNSSKTNKTIDNSMMIECACCFGDTVFEHTAQCCEGHLVCKECLTNYTKEKVFGSGKLELACMESDCRSTYPQSELRRCLPLDIQEKLEECILESDLKKANIKDLTRCSYCNYAAILSPTSKAFFCRKPDCQKLTCRTCGVDWDGHEEKTCDQMEQKDEMALRKKFEEDMTKSKIRTCHACGAEFLKEDGCNKMVCRCGTTMCYVCRKPGIHYNHFCRHVRDPGCPCRICRACSLWTTTEDDEELAIRELKREAQEKRRGMGYLDDKLIGPPDEKRPRLAE